MKKITLAVIAVISSVGSVFSQANITIQAPTANGNTQLRAPNGTNIHGGLKACLLIKQSELTALTGSIVNSMAFDILAGTGSSSAAGNFTVYLQNTTDITYQKGTSFSGALVGMTPHFSGIYTVPGSPNPSTVTLNFTPTFTYTGGGIYVAFEWSFNGPYSANPATYNANYIQGGGLGATSYNTPPPAANTMTLTDFRPAFIFNAVNTATNELGVLRMDAAGKTPISYGAQFITAQVQNASTVSQSSVQVSLNIAGANTFADIQTIPIIAAGAVITVTFAPFTPNATGINNMTVTIPSDQNVNNNAVTWTQSVTCVHIAIPPPLVASTYTSSAYGAGASANGLIYAFKHTPSINTTLSAVRVVIPSFVNAANLGKQLRAVLLDGVGNIMALGNLVTITAPMMDVFTAFNFSNPLPTLTAGNNYNVGIAIPANGYFPIGVTAFTNFPNPGFSTFPISGGPATTLNVGYLSLEGVLNSPTLAVSNNTTICMGASATLTVSGAPTFTWSTGSNAPAIVVSPSSNTTYSVSTGTGVCLSSAFVLVSVMATPTVSISGPAVACVGAQVSWLASGANSYTWSTGSFVQSTSIPTGTAGIFSFTVSGANAPCGSASAVKNITITALPTVNMTATTPTVCAMANGGSTVQLAGTPSGGNFTGAGLSGNGVFTPNSAGTTVISYNYSDPSTGCSNTATYAIQVIVPQATVSVSASSPTVCTLATGGKTIQLTGMPSGGNYSGTGVSGSIFTPGSAGVVNLTYLYIDPANGCSKSASTSVQVVTCAVPVGIQNNTVINQNLSAYPNPSVKGIVGIHNLEGTNTIFVYNVLGDLLAKYTTERSEYLLDLSGKADGNYFIKVTDANGHSKTLKVVHQN